MHFIALGHLSVALIVYLGFTLVDLKFAFLPWIQFYLAFGEAFVPPFFHAEWRYQISEASQENLISRSLLFLSGLAGGLVWVATTASVGVLFWCLEDAYDFPLRTVVAFVFGYVLIAVGILLSVAGSVGMVSGLAKQRLILHFIASSKSAPTTRSNEANQ